MPDNSRPDVELAQDIVTLLAPHELPLFPAVSRTFAAERDGKGLRSGGGDDILGFGVAEAGTFLTPIALVAAKEVLEFLTVEILKEVGKEGREQSHRAPARFDPRRWSC